jgi:hypothetical protein
MLTDLQNCRTVITDVSMSVDYTGVARCASKQDFLGSRGYDQYMQNSYIFDRTNAKKLGRITYGRLLKSPDLSPGHPRRFKPVYHEGSRRIRCWTVSDRKHKRSQELCLGPGHSNAECARFGVPNGVRCIGSPSNLGGGGARIP